MARRRDLPSDSREDSEEEFLGVDDPAAQVLESAVKSTPWWALSLAFHGVILATLPLIIFSQKIFAHETTGVEIKIRPQQVVVTDDGKEKKAGLFDSPEIPGAPETTSDEKFVFMPDAIEGDHIETANDKDTHTAYGDSLEFNSWTPGESNGLKGRMPGTAPGTNDSIGPGGGAGSSGRYGTRTGGGKINMIRRGSGGKHEAIENSVKAGLRWLARHQSPDGRWDAASFEKNCKKGGHCEGSGVTDFDVGVTGLALLAFLGAGHTPQNRESVLDPVTGEALRFGDTVRRGLDWLISQQRPDGSIGPGIGEMMYNHAIASLALSEAYGITNAVVYRAPAQKAITFIHQAQNYNLGWRYTAKCGDNDTSVTGWCVMALKSAQISGLDVAQTAFEGAKAWIARVTDQNGQTGYDRLGSGEIFVPGKNESWLHHPSMTAVGMACRMFIDKKKGDPMLPKGAKILTEDLPRWDPKAARPTVDFYYWYYASLALWQFDGPEGPSWARWNKAMLDAILPHQHSRRDGCQEGSWDVSGVDRWGYAGGRVYATSMNVLTLEVYYRYQLLFAR
jgi:hypothetical protein